MNGLSKFYNGNACWIVRRAKGEIKHFDLIDVRKESNPTYRFSFETEIPDSWIAFKENEKLAKGN